MLLAPGFAERSLPEGSYGTLSRRRSPCFSTASRSSNVEQDLHSRRHKVEGLYSNINATGAVSSTAFLGVCLSGDDLLALLYPLVIILGSKFRAMATLVAQELTKA